MCSALWWLESRRQSKTKQQLRQQLPAAQYTLSFIFTLALSWVVGGRENNWVANYSTVALDCHALPYVGFRLTWPGNPEDEKLSPVFGSRQTNIILFSLSFFLFLLLIQCLLFVASVLPSPKTFSNKWSFRCLTVQRNIRSIFTYMYIYACGI